jgi:hypothetical protein
LVGDGIRRGSFQQRHGGWYSDPTNSSWQAYDDFTLSSASTITGIEWWGFYFPGNTPPATDAFMYDIQSNPGGGGGPSGDITSGSLGDGSPIDTGSYATTTSGTLEFYEYSAAVNIALPAGAYFLSIDDTASNPGNVFCWATTPESPTDIWDIYSGSTWESQLAYYGDTGYGLEGAAFNLTGESSGATVPEPATMTLLGLGLAGLATKVARRKNR